MDNLHFLALLVIGTLLFGVYGKKLWVSWQGRQAGVPFPPGPPPLPILGNIRDIPSKQPWLTYTQWGDQYGALRSE